MCDRGWCVIERVMCERDGVVRERGCEVVTTHLSQHVLELKQEVVPLPLVATLHDCIGRGAGAGASCWW